MEAKVSSDRADSAGQGNAEGGSRSGHVIPRDERLGTMIFAAVLMLFGLFWIYASSDLPNRQQTAYLSQGFLPIAAGILLAILSALLFVSTWLTSSRPAAELGKEPLFEPRAEARAAAVFVALLVYILILPHIHYLISTFLLMAAGLYLARERLGIRLVVMAAAMAALFFGIFVWGLGVPLPGSGFE
jgi:putative tricarboxylic transport membrane protein